MLDWVELGLVDNNCNIDHFLLALTGCSLVDLAFGFHVNSIVGVEVSWRGIEDPFSCNYLAVAPDVVGMMFVA